MTTAAEECALVPKLRFPEFLDAEGWGVKNLKNVCEVNPSNVGLPEKFVYIDLEAVEAGKLKWRKIIYQEEAPSRAQRLLRYGDVIFQIVRPYQRNNLHFKINEEIPYVASTGYAQLRANESEDFLFQAVHTDGFVEQVIAKCTGSSYPAINSSDLAELQLAIPQKAEQQKIADCLASIDELITLESQKLDTLKRHKKGLMQQLFPAEGETAPRLRFPEFRGAKKWQRMRLEEISTFHKGKGIAKADIAPNGKNLCIRYGELYTTYGEVIDKIISKTNLQSKDLFLSCRNDVLVPSSGETRQDIAKASCVMVDDVALGSDLNIIRSTENGIFLSYLLNGSCSKEIARIAQGDTVVHLYASQLKLLVVAIPDLAEQQKIADCLGSLDDVIAMQARKVDALKTHKKGLMQQLFPAPDGFLAAQAGNT